jgi:hypothetical protein
MWQIKNPQLKPSTLDFGSSGQGKHPVWQLFADGVELINALELVDWDSEETQFLVCEECGHMGCKSADWVSVRRSDSLVFILPASNYVWGDKKDKDVYSPPAYLKKHGLAYFEFSTYESLRSRHPSFPPIHEIHPLTLREATLLFHWDAPDQVLGNPPEVHVRGDIVVGASEGNSAEHLQQIENLIECQYRAESLAQLRRISSSEGVIALYLESFEFREWKALVFDGSAYRLLVDSAYVIETTSAS